MRLEVDQAKQQGVNEITRCSQPAPEGVAEWIGKEPFVVDRRDSRPVSDIVNMAFLVHASNSLGLSRRRVGRRPIRPAANRNTGTLCL